MIRCYRTVSYNENTVGQALLPAFAELIPVVRDLIPSFTWTSGTPIDAYIDAGATTAYVSGTATLGTIYIKPSIQQLEDPNFTFTANATLTNGCVINKDITIQNKTKIWQGLSSKRTRW